MKPLASVCIPAYNNEAYIKETIDSILRQTYSNLELVIVDDNSKDNTAEVIKSIKDERIKFYQNEKNLGMSGNWNRCLELCTGEFIKLICADDMLTEDALGKEVNALIENPGAVLAESDTQLFDLKGKPKGFYKRYPSNGLTDGKLIAKKGFMLKNYFGAPLANTFRRSALDKIGGFDPWFTYILDYDFWVRIACLGDVYIIHEPLNYFRVRNDSNTGEVMGGGKSDIYVEEHRHLLEKNRKTLHLTNADIRKSVRIRKLRNFAGGVYLKLFVR